MTRTQAIDLITTKLDQLPDERLETLAEMATAWTEPTVYASLSDAEKAEIDAALDELDRGEGIPGDQVFAELRQRVATARSKAGA